MRVLVTGANGFVGNNLVRELLSKGYRVTCFVQHNQPTHTLTSLDVDIRFGDILDLPSLLEAAEGCQAMVHTVASTALWPYYSEIQWNVNVAGTQNVITTVQQKGLKRLIYIGTANSFGYGDKQNPGNETLPYMGERYHLGYWDTKYEAQQLVLKAVQEDNLPAVVVNPTFMFGDFASLLGSGKMIQAVYQGKLPGYTQGGRNYIAVQDVCVGIANAIEKGRVGECYILGNQNLSYQEIFTLIAKTIGANPPKRFLPKPIVLVYGGILTFLGRIVGFEPTVNYRMAQISFDKHYYSAQKAIKELDLPQTPIEEAIQEAFRSLKANKSI